MSLSARLSALALAAAFSGLGGPAAHAAQPPREDFALGQSASSGTICQAKRDWDAPWGQAKDRRIWSVDCRGYADTKLGAIYRFRTGDAAAERAWREALAGYATCDFNAPTALDAAPGVQAFVCDRKGGKGGHFAYRLQAGDYLVVADGLSPLADVTATGVQVAAGRRSAPAATSNQALAFSAGAELASLNAAAAQTASIDKRREAAYRDTQVWKFGEAANLFGALATANDVSADPVSRAEAYLNLALNLSNGAGNFADADGYFKAADALVGQVNAQWLSALALNYKAAHARNQRQFERAIELADQAIKLRASDPDVAADLQVGQVTAGTLRIGLGQANALNAGVQRLSSALSPGEQALARDAQAWRLIGTSQAALGRSTEATESLRRAADILAQPRGSHRLGESTPWLTASIETDIARLERSRGDSSQSIHRLRKAIDSYDQKSPDTLVTGHMLIELARAEAADKQDDAAIRDFERAFAIFKTNRGSLGPSADSAANYFDLLLDRIGSDPAAHRPEIEKFYISSEALIADSTALASLQASERLSTEGSASAGISRAREDTLRQIEELKRKLRIAQAGGSATADDVRPQQAAIQTLAKQADDLSQQLAIANPKYFRAMNPTADLAKLQAALRPGEAYVKVLLLAKRGYGVLITQTSAQPYRIELSRQQASVIGTQLRKPFDDVGATGRLQRYNVALARELYGKLFGPVDAQMKAVTRIIYQPDPSLIGVPIAALVADDESVAADARNLAVARQQKTAFTYANVNWLGATHDTSVAFSTGAFVAARSAVASKADRAFIGYGDPQFAKSSTAFASVSQGPSALRGVDGVDVCSNIRQRLLALPSLPETASEVRAVAAAFNAPDGVRLEGAFTDQAVRKDGSAGGELSRYRIVYFATHGLMPLSGGCLQPALVTSSTDDGGDALLDTREIDGLFLDADLVVLSACDTGNREGEGGAALGSLVASFTTAGARNLLVSNWKVDSAGTELLMKTLFTGAADSQGDALEAAQKAFMGRSDQYAHPYYWAAFSIVGDSARQLPRL